MALVQYFECEVKHCDERIEVDHYGVPHPDSGWGSQMGGVCPKHRQLIQQFEFELNNWSPRSDRRPLKVEWPADAWLPDTGQDDRRTA